MSGSEFFAMGGYGAYVWGAYGVCAVSIALEIGLLALRRRDVIGFLRQQRAAGVRE
jgi:heme exporter protein D